MARRPTCDLLQPFTKALREEFSSSQRTWKRTAALDPSSKPPHGNLTRAQSPDRTFLLSRDVTSSLLDATFTGDRAIAQQRESVGVWGRQGVPRRRKGTRPDCHIDNCIFTMPAEANPLVAHIMASDMAVRGSLVEPPCPGTV